MFINKVKSSFLIKRSSLRILSIFRIFYFGYFLYQLSYFISFTKVPDAFWTSWPAGVFGSRPSVETVIVIGIVAKIFFYLTTIGFLTRINSLCAALTFVYLHAYTMSFGYLNSHFFPFVVFNFILVFSPMGELYSVDYILKKYFFKKSVVSKTLLKHSSLVVKSCQSYFCIVMFATGTAKLRTSGFSWVSENSLRNIMLKQNITYEGQWIDPLFQKINLFITSNQYLPQGFSVFVLLLETTFPIILFKPKLTKYYLFGFVFFQLGNLMAMYILFKSWFLFLLLWLPVRKLTKLCPNIKFSKNLKAHGRAGNISS